jgi:Lon protease-like protein
MSALSDLTGFDGVARLFPLPNVVLFPGVTQGLHIFEPRYRQMTADALAGDGLLATVLLQPGFEADYQGRPPIYQMACLGKITESKQLENGKYNLQLQGLARVRIESELTEGLIYRRAHVKLLGDGAPANRGDEERVRNELKEILQAWCSNDSAVGQAFQQLIMSDVALGLVCDVIAYALPLELGWKQELLEAAEVRVRTTKLLGYLRTVRVEHPPGFPPRFSDN